MFHRVV